MEMYIFGEKKTFKIFINYTFKYMVWSFYIYFSIFIKVLNYNLFN